jgi:glycosyltransferase involved in cell wall biosynthesis
MKVVLISRSDLRGGAAVFTFRLMVALRNNGVDAKMLVVEKLSADRSVMSYANYFQDKLNFLLERFEIFIRNGFSRKTLFHVDTAHYGRDISEHHWIKDADYIILNWMNQGALSLRGVKRILELGKPTIWNLHDMWCLTGICHHAYDCNRYTQDCGHCPLLKSNKHNDLSHRVWLSKSQLYRYENLHFVAVSNWIKEKCRQSSLLSQHPVSVIPNSISLSAYQEPKHEGLNQILQDIEKIRQTQSQILAIAAARLDDPVKGLPLLIAALNIFKRKYQTNIHLLLIGSLRDESWLPKIPNDYTFTGPLKPNEVFAVLHHVDVVLSTSHYESFGGTLIEGMLAGCVPVSFDNGGQRDIISHQQTGYLAQYPSTDDFADGIKWALASKISKSVLENTVLSNFGADVVAKKYIKLFDRISHNATTQEGVSR